MKTSRIIHTFAVVVVGGMLGFTTPIFADVAPASAEMLNQAFDLVHQAWNPGGDPPSNAERTELLTKALKLTQDAPDHRLKGHRVMAAVDIKAALDELKAGDPNQKAGEFIHNAADELRTAVSLAN